MGLTVSDIKSIVLKNGSGYDISQQVVQNFKKLIDNDLKSTSDEITIAPKLWECKWLNNSSDKTLYYNVGDAVWLNCDTPEDILISRREDISSYVTQNYRLNQLFAKINQDDAQEVNNFFLKVINGTACDGISALYYPGDILKAAQIRISNKNYNTSLPDDDSKWHDFYEPTTVDDCKKVIYDLFQNQYSDQISTHMQDYHGIDIKKSTLENNYLFNDSQRIKEDSTKQYFYNHSFFKTMTGFDYVVKYEYNNYNWYRLWSSGYLEQGGFVINDGSDTITVNLLVSYNYPQATNFYQYGFDEFNGNNVEGNIDYMKRYCVTVTPQIDEGIEPYQMEAMDTNGNKTYGCVDVMDMNNDSFTFVNTDSDVKFYSMYSYSVCGFRRVTDTDGYNGNSSTAIHKVNFYDTLG